MAIWQVRGLKLLRDDQIYWPAEDSLLMLDALDPDLSGKVCLDLGTGSGIVAIEMAKRGCCTVASDISQRSCLLASRNAELNGLEVHTVQGDMTRHFRDLAFDLIAFNPPYLPGRGDPRWAGGRRGRELIDALIDDLPRLMREKALILHADFNLPELTLRKAEKMGLRAEICLRRKLAFHELMIVRISRA